VSTDKQKEANAKIEFKYVFPDDYNPSYANGAVGGITPKGELIINYYVERPPLPYSVTHALDANGTIGEQLEKDPNKGFHVMVRVVTSGVILNHTAAREIHEWLGKHLEVLEAAKEEKDDKV
jgi:hypothetical protein